MARSNLINLSHEVSFSCNQGELVPAGWLEMLPGDVLRGSTSMLVRTQPLLAPLYANCEVQIDHFYCPFRILWDAWEDFITGGDDGLDASVVPYITSPASTGYAINSLADYLGKPTGAASKDWSAFLERAYGDIYNLYYRDQLLQTEVPVSRASGADVTTNETLQNACWKRDYFTKARSEPQLGTPVSIPLTGDAPLTYAASTSGSVVRDATTGNPIAANKALYGKATTGMFTETTYTTPYDLDVSDSHSADLSGVSAVDIDSLTLAAALQRYKRNVMMYGARYFDRLGAAWGVKNLDARLSQPEHLGGGRQVIQFSEVLQTAEGTDPVGELRGHGIARAGTNRFKRYCPEHGVVMTLVTVRPKTMYPNAVDRLFLRRTKEDFFQPELMNLGMQEVYDGEVYGGAASQFNVWGYTDRYDEYRSKFSRVCGEFRDTLKHWNMARFFASQPSLNSDFVKCTPRTDVYAAPSADQLYIRAFHNMKCKRQITRVARPMLF